MSINHSLCSTSGMHVGLVVLAPLGPWETQQAQDTLLKNEWKKWDFTDNKNHSRCKNWFLTIFRKMQRAAYHLGACRLHVPLICYKKSLRGIKIYNVIIIPFRPGKKFTSKSYDMGIRHVVRIIFVVGKVGCCLHSLAVLLAPL